MITGVDAREIIVNNTLSACAKKEYVENVAFVWVRALKNRHQQPGEVLKSADFRSCTALTKGNIWPTTIRLRSKG